MNEIIFKKVTLVLRVSLNNVRMNVTLTISETGDFFMYPYIWKQ